MKNFIAYINTIASNPIIPKKAKYTTTILMPELDTTEGIYRSVLPAYVINGADKDLRMLIVGLSAKMNISHNSKDFHIDKKLIAETDHFVFPFVSYPLQPAIDDIRALKPSVKFSYYIDANFYLMPEAYPFSKEYKLAKMIENIENNIKAVDRVIVTNKALMDYILKKLAERHPGITFGTMFYYQRLFILPDLMKTDYSNDPVKGKIKALIIGDEYQFSDIHNIVGILKDLKCKYKDAFELNIIGWDGKRGDRTYLQQSDFNYHARVPYSKYFELIRHIGPDVLIIPSTKSKFNDTSKNYVKYLEFAHMNIPVIAPEIAPYTDLVETNKNGFLCADKDAYKFQLETMYTEPAKYEATLGVAYATAFDYNIAEASNIDKLKTIYFPDYGKK
jgi:glycosyltransferase involved in cell wall biosynthesis